MFFLQSRVKKTFSFFDRLINMISFSIKMFFAPDLHLQINWQRLIALTMYS